MTVFGFFFSMISHNYLSIPSSVMFRDIVRNALRTSRSKLYSKPWWILRAKFDQRKRAYLLTYVYTRYALIDAPWHSAILENIFKQNSYLPIKTGNVKKRQRFKI